MGKRKKAEESNPAKTAAKGAAAYYGIKKLFKVAFIVAGIAAATKVLRSKSATA